MDRDIRGGIWTSRLTYTQMGMHAGRQAGRQAGGRAGGRADRHVSRDRPPDRPARMHSLAYIRDSFA